MKKTVLKEIAIGSLMPLLIPFILEIPDVVIASWLKWVLFGLSLTIYAYWSVKFHVQRNHDNSSALLAQIVRKAYSNAYRLSEQKMNAISKKTFDSNYHLPKEMIPYDVHDYIAEICKNFRDTISGITSISEEYMSVTFIYRYVYKNANDESKSWRWLVGKEPSTRCELNEFVKRENSLYNYLINGEGIHETLVFANDKADLEKDFQYYMSARDKNHNKIGSVFASRIMFGNNATSFVEGILIVSSYGKRFVEKETQDYTEDKLRNILLEELFPYYQRLLEKELGILYLRHDQGNSTP